MILWGIHCSFTSPSHEAAETLSPALASGVNSHVFDEETIHLFEVVLQSVVVARQQTRSQRRFEHVAFEFDPVADFQTARAVVNLHIGVVADDFDDLGHHFGIARPHVTDLVLGHRPVRLDDDDVGDDTVYTSCSFHI